MTPSIPHKSGKHLFPLAELRQLGRIPLRSMKNDALFEKIGWGE